MISRDHRLPTSPIYPVVCKENIKKLMQIMSSFCAFQNISYFVSKHRTLVKCIFVVIYSCVLTGYLLPNITTTIFNIICRYGKSTETERVMIIFTNLISSHDFFNPYEVCVSMFLKKYYVVEPFYCLWI